MGMGMEWEYNQAKPGIANGNGNEPLGMGGNGIDKDIPAHLQTVVPECFKGDNASQWKSMERGEIQPPAPHKNPEPIVSKIGMGDDVRDSYPCAKKHYDPIKGFCPPACARWWTSLFYGAKLCLCLVPMVSSAALIKVSPID